VLAGVMTHVAATDGALEARASCGASAAHEQRAS
jgi:hypothetical protein